MKRTSAKTLARKRVNRKPARVARRVAQRTSPHGDSAQTPFAEGYAMPAEWEPHEATWLAWPHEASDWPGKFEVIAWVFAEMARVLTQGERVRLIVGSAAEKKRASAVFASAGVDLKRVDFVTAATDRSWTRDFVPSFVVKRGVKARQRGALAAARFRFDGWHRYPNHKKDVAAGLAALKFGDTPAFEPVVTLDSKRHHVVLEGGAIDVDGEGTLLATEECLLDGKQARNPELGRGLTEQVLRDFLGAQKVVWLGRGIAGDDTGGHVDDFARFVAPGRVVVAQELDKKDPNHRVLGEALERLRGARDARGRRFDIVPLPMPAPIVFDGQRLPASYANFYVASEAVLVPTFNDPNDRVALGIFGELFPGRDIVGIYSRDLVLGLGTLHCSTQQEPRP